MHYCAVDNTSIQDTLYRGIYYYYYYWFIKNIIWQPEAELHEIYNIKSTFKKHTQNIMIKHKTYKLHNMLHK